MKICIISTLVILNVLLSVVGAVTGAATGEGVAIIDNDNCDHIYKCARTFRGQCVKITKTIKCPAETTSEPQLPDRRVVIAAPCLQGYFQSHDGRCRKKY